VTAESWLTDGRPAAPFERAEDRAVMAAGLAEIVRRCAPLHGLRALDAELLRPPPPAGVWPEPLDPRLSFTAPVPEAAWIDALGLRARRRRRAATGTAVVGHGDWHAEHVRVAGGRVTAVYDWDSLMRAPEPFLVGCAVAGFTADWSRHEPPVVPPLASAETFLERYEAARGAPFSPAERTTVRAHWVEITAYAARLELAREAAGLPAGDRYRAELAEHGARLI
jgi:hypothetical protein